MIQTARFEFLWQLTGLASSRYFEDLRNDLATLKLSDDQRQMLLAILLVEGTQRPPWLRAIEWIAWRTFRLGGIAARAPKTRGPFQMTDAPNEFKDAAKQALRRLENINPRDLAQVAEVWNGQTRRHSRASFTYQEALAMALGVLSKSEEAKLTKASTCLSKPMEAAAMSRDERVY